MHEKQEMSRSFFRDARQRDDPILNKISADIISYRDGTAPNWLDEAPGMSRLRNSVQRYGN